MTSYIGEGLAGGRWRKTMPWRNLLAKELGVSRKTVESALNKLEEDGFLISQGAGRPRRIVRWANNVSQGRHDRRQTATRAEFIPGGIIGPVPGA